MRKKGDLKGKTLLLLSSARREVRKATFIGRRMIEVIEASDSLKKTYNLLGQLCYEAIGAGEIDWNNPRVESLCKRIVQLEQKMRQMEDEVQKAKGKSKRMKEAAS